MSEELTKEEKFSASKLLLSGFMAEVIGGGSIFLIVLVIGLVDPFLAAFLIIIIAASTTLGCGLIMLWLGNPYNVFWRKAKGIYEDVADGKLDNKQEITEINQGMKVKTDGTVFTKSEIDLEDIKEESEALGTIIEKAIEDKALLNGEIALAEANIETLTTEKIE